MEFTEHSAAAVSEMRHEQTPEVRERGDRFAAHLASLEKGERAQLSEERDGGKLQRN